MTYFQSHKPLAPYLYEAITTILHEIMSRFVKKEVLDKSKDLTKIDVQSTENLILSTDIELPFGIREAIRANRKCIKDKDLSLFRKNCVKILQEFCKKLFFRSPIKYTLTKAISFLDPAIAKDSQIRDTRLKSALDIFIRNGWVKSTEADKISIQFKNICKKDTFLETLKSFDKYKDRLDHLWIQKLIGAENLEENMVTSDFLVSIFILSHGNANTEREFSINKECLIENLNDESLIAQRITYDAVIRKGGKP